MRRIPLPTPRLALLTALAALTVGLEYLGLPGRWIALGLLVLLGFLSWLDWRISFSALELHIETDLPEILSNGLGYNHRVFLLWDGLPGRARGVLTQVEELGYRAEPDLMEFDTDDDHAVFDRRLELAGRGDLELPVWRVRMTGRLGLVQMQQEVESGEHHRVYPDLSPLKHLSLPSSRRRRFRTGQRLLSQPGEGGEFDHLREFHPGDDIRKVSWRAVAKHRKPIVIETRAQREEALLVALDAGRRSSTRVDGRRRYEYFLDTAIDLVVTANRQGDRTGLLVFADEVLTFIPPDRRYGRVEAMLEELYHIFPTQREPDYPRMVNFVLHQFTRRGRLVMFSELSDSISSQAALGACRALSRHHQTLVATLHSAHVLDRYRAPVHGDTALFERAIEADEAVQRRRTIERLRHSGIRIVDTEPERLGARVIDEYLEMRRRNS